MSQDQIRVRTAVLVSLAEPLLQVGVRAALAGEPDMEVIAADLTSVSREIDVLVTDTATAAKIAGDARRSELGQNLQCARILVLAREAREQAIRAALEQGVHGFLLTNSPVGDLLGAIRTLSRGAHYLCTPAVQQLTHVVARDMLTSREAEVLRLLAKGNCNKSISRDLNIAVGTVKAHVKSIMSKLDANCRTEAASIATARGLVDIADPVLRRVKEHRYPAARLAA
jgi:two-component system NarL family response regulator